MITIEFHDNLEAETHDTHNSDRDNGLLRSVGNCTMIQLKLLQKFLGPFLTIIIHNIVGAELFGYLNTMLKYFRENELFVPCAEFKLEGPCKFTKVYNSGMMLKKCSK
jgi:hypothetical protein